MTALPMLAFLVALTGMATSAQPLVVRDTLVQVAGREVYIAMPPITQDGYRVVLALHGSGREARSYKPGDSKANAFYVRQRDLAVKNGYLFVVVSNGSDTWGTDRGLNAVLDAYRYIEANFRVQQKWVLWGSSAGGGLMYRLIKEYPAIVDRALGTFAVYDLSDAFKRLTSARHAWRCDSTFKDINPAAAPKALAQIPLMLFHGIADQTVPLEAHSGRLVQDVKPFGGSVELYKAPGGHDTANMSLYPDRLINDFLRKKIN